ncbi:HMCN1 protein, partial [Formicarius rufipectus]|nr:HMCN1 protein [Formicarius rufipectus]
GGGDCPEMSIGAIKIALEISLPGSFIYVFTDARSKDYRLTHEVLQLIQQKQSQVVFVLTGDCDDRDHIGYKVYEEIASTSSGQVFHLDKKQVNEVLKWVEEAVQASKVHLLSTDHLSMAVNTWQIPFDPSLKEVTVSLSGPSPAIEIHNPLGNRLSKESGLNELLNIHNSAKVVNVKDPEPGTWTIKTSSSGRHSVRITGLSTIDFRAGFSRRPTLDFKTTSSRPVQGIPTFVLLNTTGILLPARVDRLELLSITGELLKTLPVKYYPDRKPYGLWNISDFIPPAEAFFVKITGYDKDDYLFQRVSSVSFSSITPDAPKVTMPMKIPGYYLQPGSIPCHVESLIPFTQYFTKNGVKLGVDQFFRESSSVSWDVARVALTDEGFYECVASSAAGTGRAQTFLDVSEPPPTIEVPHNVTVAPGAVATLTCLVHSALHYNLSWQRAGRDARLAEPARIRLLANLSLEVREARPADAGPYGCTAASWAGTAAGTVLLSVQEPPRLVISPRNQTFTAGSEVSLRCSALGYPKPTVVWTHNEMFLVGSSRYRLTPEGTLIIRKAIPKDAGIYGCLASNSAGTDKQTSTLTYIEGPTLTVVQSEILVGVGDTTVMECKTTGIPPPQVTWFKGDLELRASSFLTIDTHRGLLKIQETQDLDAGDYTCVATNDAGRASGKITLDVGSAPVFTQEPSDETGELRSNVTLPCHARGSPEPRITWRRLDGTPLSPRPSGALVLHDLWVSDEGTYVCEAENQFGRIQSRPATVTVTGLVKPLIGASPATASVIEGQQLTLPCVLLAGNPIPDRRWIKNNMVVVPSPYVSVRSDGSLHLERVRLQDGGHYTCTASSVAGTANRTTAVSVHVVPVIQHGQQIFSTIEGIPVTLPCKASGVPKPSIVWSKKGEVILPSSVGFSGGSDGSLTVVSPRGEDSGEYTCGATNAAGSATRKVQLTVYVKPRVSRPGDQQGNGPIEVSVLAGEDVTLPCEVRSLPPPIITWAKEMQLISPFSPRHTFLPSGSMKISETQVSDSGMYICVATNIAGNVTQSVKLSVHVPARIQRGPRVVTALSGQRVELPCSAHGVPTPALTWLRGHSTVAGGPFGRGPDGALTISSVQPAHAGAYECVATNAAGRDAVEVTLHVLVSPSIEDLDPPYNSPFQERVANQRVALPCPARGVPKPAVKWLHNGREVTGSEPGVSLLEGGTLLVLAAVTPSDGGEYVCVATNEAGSAERTYSLHVNVPPEIRDQEKVTNSSVVVDHPVSLFCEVTGNPFPVISWYKEDIQVVESSAVQISHNGKILKLLKAVPEDAGQYSCKAINVAGSSEKLFNLDILVAPGIAGADSPGEVTVILSQEISLECRAKGFPAPDIHWFKDGKPLFLGDPNVELLDRDQVLRIKNVRRVDKGRYQCSATNTAGKQLKEVKLIVHVPPSIKGGNVTTEVSVLLNNLISLECETKGIPVPTITWYKDGHPLISSPQAQYVDRGQFLQIPRAQESDSAKYTCRVRSAAGAAEKGYHVDVYVPPVIEGDADTAQSRQVVAGSSLLLECNAAGNPAPLLTWLKDGVPVEAGDNLRVLAGGKKLEIVNVVEADRGQYWCVATSVAGEQEIKYEVEILVPPFVEGGDELLDYIVILQSPLELDCSAAGIPSPTITWFKDGHPVEEGAGHKILLKGQKLVISQAQVSDTGRYKCVAANKAGEHEKEFDVMVHVPPTIKPTGPSERAVVIHQPVTLQCIASGIPSPSITWLKDGQPVNAAGGNLRLESSGRALQLAQVLPHDAARYTCVATNAAGEAQRHVRLLVHEPPSLENAGKILNETVVVNNPVHLECRATGNPPPGTHLSFGQLPAFHPDVAPSLALEPLLVVLSDAGLYSCRAANAAGAAELLHSLQVHGEGTAGSPTDTFSVHPLPPLLPLLRPLGSCARAWASFADVQPKPPLAQVLSGGRVLALPSAQLSAVGTYTCVAVNAAGESQRDVQLRVLVPPDIVGEEQNVSVLAGQALELRCQSNAVPPPLLSWHKDGRALLRKPGLSVSEDGTVLKVEGAQVQDTGRYTCEATNVAGRTEKNYNVNIWVSPSISGSDDSSQLTVTEGNMITLTCESSGIPPPSLTWKKNGSALEPEPSGRVRVLSGGRQLQIAVANLSDAASYTCIASNVAGSARREYSLQVYVRPRIVDGGAGPSEVVVPQGSAVSLACEAQGIPEPTVAWLKDGQPVGTGGHLHLLRDGRVLRLERARLSDGGRYLCVATNAAGLADSEYHLSVHVPPSIAGYLQMPENISIVEKNPVSLVCEASGIPLPAITWLKDGEPITLSDSVRVLSGGRTLRVTHTGAADAGRYSCVVTNAAGQLSKDFHLSILVPPGIVGEDKLEDVRVKENHGVTLTCEVTGSPAPRVSWLKDGQPVPEDGQLRVAPGGRSLHIPRARVADTGRYTCVASNAAGDRSRTRSLNVLVAPSIVGADSQGDAEGVTVVLNSPTSLLCEAYSYPPATITWLKDGKPLESSRNIRILPGGRTLQILSAQEDSAGRYTCRATNEAGEASKHYEVKVHIPPTISREDLSGTGLSPREVKIRVNHSLTLQCEVQAVPAAAISWYKDGQASANLSASWDGHVLVQASGQTLHIEEAQVSDTGRYTCVASNVAGEDELEFDVNIQVPPSFQKPPREWEAGNSVDAGRGGQRKDVIVNNPLSLYCETNAVPPPVLTWYKDGTALSSTDRVLILPGGRVLQVPRARPTDAGTYSCVAQNEAGQDSIHYHVHVLFPPSMGGTEGDLPQEVTVLAGRVATMDCLPSGSPSPSITWQKDGQLLPEDDKHMVLSSGRNLQILNSQITDTGRYVCIAENIAGSAKKYFNLNVHVPPSVVGANPENLTVVVNNFISLTCEVTGFPPPDLSWLKNGKPLSSNSNTFIVPGARMLQIPRARLADDGEYTCIAKNQAGESQKKSLLTVLVPPSIKDPGGASLAVLNVRVGSPVTLDCESNAIPPPVITWYKNRLVISESAHVEILADGQTLQIKSAEVSDTGQYVCKAINIAGRDDKNFHLNVYVPPSIEGPEQELVSESISNPVTFVCDAAGIPPPTLVWLKNGKPIESSDSLEVHVLSGGSKLRIAHSQLLDSRTYTCVASNVEGEAQKTYVLSIQAPPDIAGSEVPSEVGALQGQGVQLLCRARGVPAPRLRWLKDGKPHQTLTVLGDAPCRVSPDGSTLNISSALSSDTGKYTCVATNAAGEEDRIFNLNVYVPPAIANGKDEAEELTALVDTSLNIECTATGTPPPQLHWLKNGLPLPVSSQVRLLSAGHILRLARVQISDAGVYTCVASNRAGVDNRHYNLQVFVPPALDKAGGTEEVRVPRGSATTMDCVTTGTPAPSVAWLKDGHPLALGAHLALSRQGMALHVAAAGAGDEGTYTCLATNQAGEASKNFILSVLEPPHINGSDEPEELSVIVNNPLELVCISSGIPVPKISWMKDGRPLLQTENIHVLGEALRITSAQVEDTGRYTCLASSPAGDDDKEYLVRVHVPPNIAGTGGPQDLTVLQNRQVTLECKSDAVPPPTISWLRNGAPLEGTPRVRILAGGRYLQINNAELGDTARYTCVARNVAGEVTREFLLTVHVAPTIRSGPQTVVVQINASALLECAAQGVPAPRVAWRKEGAVFTGNNTRYSVAEEGSLHIPSAQVADAGRYVCMATNSAGTERRRVDLQVLVPPTIAPGQTNITVTVNVQTTLPCETTGIPKPAVGWKKNGHLLSIDQNQNTYRLLSSGSLTIISPTVDDTGVYECSVSNDAGEDQRAVELTVQVPPSIADEATDLLVTKLSPVVISCTASGLPVPSLHWTKDGMKLLPRGDGYRILSSGAVEVPSAQLAHAGRYTCVARNAAGAAHRHVTLQVQEPPVIQAQPGALDVVVNDPIVLPCEATGTPRPVITWQKEGINIITSGSSFVLLPSGSLQVARAAVEHAGTYMCVAQNPAGTALGKIKLKVQVPPVIKPHLKEYVVLVDQSVTLQCEAEGSPGPEISWHKDGQQILESLRRRVLSSGALQLVFVQPGDSGRYTCTATNPAGSSSASAELTVHVPPRIHSTEEQYTVTEDSQAVLSCVADGIPAPTVTWKKDNTLLTERVGKYQTVPGGDLILDNVVPEDSGTYTCVAANAAGEDTHTVTLIVHVLPAFTELPGDVALTKGEQLKLTCKATGIPVPQITWTFNNNIIPAQYDDVNGHSELLIDRVSKDDSGTYVCTAENTVGSIKAVGFVHVKEPPVFKGDSHSSRVEPLGGNAMLNCEVRGDPPPTIQWSKKGVGVQISNRIQQLVNGSLAIYGTVNDDAGDYTCVATNEAGVVERSLTLTLQSPPVLTVEPVGTVVDAGAAALLHCRAGGEPVPTVAWWRQGRPVASDERVSILPNGTLRVAPARREDTAEYQCVARNALGSALAGAPLTVQVHGGYSSWLEWRPCSVSCGRGLQQRVRQCNDPVPANGGRGCRGPDTDVRVCHGEPCPVDGGWSEWGPWEECSRSCGQGSRSRSRSCSAPLAQHGGQPCPGSAAESVPCSVRPCPVDGEWSPWLPWGPCSVTCGKGTQNRARLCASPAPAHGGAPCHGPDTQLQLCQRQRCPVDGRWSPWGSWSACGVSCGGGSRQRTRRCSDPAPQFGGHRCEGSDTHVDFCNSDPCPVHGSWGPWGSWGSCSRTCGGGHARRHRGCDYPSPASGGRGCPGPDTQSQRCGTQPCPVDGNWGQWQSWSQCSASCGGGEQSRVRLCSSPAPLNRGRPCPGDSSQVSRCNTHACPGGPTRAKGSITGSINGVEFGAAFLNATVTDSPGTDTRVIQAEITNVPRSLGPAMRKLISMLSPVYWTTAKEIGEAMNGFTLTDAVFKRETQVEFATGEILRLTHVARGLDSDGALLLDVLVSGHVLQLPALAELSVKDYTEDYIQTGPGQLYAHSTRLFSVDGVSIPYTWNHSITYDHTKGKMPFLVETLHASSIATEYNPLEEAVAFKIQASIAKGDRSNQCPAGFGLDSSGPYCSDEDECAVGNPCSHTCHNTVGSYYCSCPKGLAISADGRTCQDIDECALGGHGCPAGQDCENTVGSFRCVLRCGSGFRRAPDGFSCQDVNECQESNSCHQRCFNTIGSFHCGCDPGFQLKGRKCMDVNECRQNVCRPDQLCKNTRGGYKCIDLCPSGMTKAENGTCIDVDECRAGSHQCRAPQRCENTRGGHRCLCPRGFRAQPTGTPCVDINECDQVPKPCALWCTNTPGSFKCLCAPGQQLLGDGKSCAGLERLPGSGAFYSSSNYAQFSPGRDNHQQQQYYRHSSNLYSSFSEYRNSRVPFSRTRRNVRETCPEGYEARNGRCVDIDECESPDTCQHECRNTPGSFQCSCPSGYRLMANGKSCQDIDECLEQNINCGSNQMCFNMRGSYQCIDTPCPPNYQREPLSGFCLKSCPANDLECDPSTYALEYKLLSLPFGIAAGQDLIRLVAYTQDGVVHPRTTFSMAEEAPAVPFGLRDEQLKGVVFTTRALREPRTYRVAVRALSFGADGGIEYRTAFVVYIAVSAYPY